MAREELVVLVENVELDSVTAVFPSASSAATATNAVVGFAVAWVWLFAVTSRAALFSALVVVAAAAVALGIAVQCRPSIVVRNAPSGRPSDAIFNPNPTQKGLIQRGQSLRNQKNWEGKK
jgi:hypothetical protein